MASKKIHLTTGQILLTLFYLLLLPAAIFLLSGDWFWPEGWIFSLWYLILCLSALSYLYRKDPALLLERFQKPGTSGQKGWDYYAVYGIVLIFWAWLLVMPLDAKRFGWTKGFPWAVEGIGFFLLIPAFFLLYRSYTDNTYLSPLVRVQKERRQKVVSTGVYGWVRHPMYLGALCWFIGGPLILGSKLGLGLGAAMALLLTARLIGEEKTLVRELKGYAAYRRKVRYRLVPGIW